MMIPPIGALVQTLQTLAEMLNILMIVIQEMNRQAVQIHIPPIPNIANVLNIISNALKLILEVFEHSFKFRKAHRAITVLRGYR